MSALYAKISAPSIEHQPVLLEEAVSALVVDPNGVYVDGTFGRGGHTRALLARLGASARLVALDRDPTAITAAEEIEDQRFTAIHSRFGDLSGALASLGITGRIDGVLLDLGVSSPQLDTPERGFSFTAEGPLDMRMNRHQGEPVAHWLTHASESEIARVIHEFGEERFARRIARAIVSTRAQSPLHSTAQLAALVAQAAPKREPGKHPATRTFQALRILINDELGELQRALDQVCDLLICGGRLAVISFHSLEDRLVKQFIRKHSKGPQLPKGVPVMGAAPPGRLRPLGKPIRPSAEECAANPRARSAILRLAERSDVDVTP